MKNDELHELARLYSIQLTYEDAGGKKRAASREALQAILRARTGNDELDDALRKRREECARRAMEPVTVVWGRGRVGREGEPYELTLESGERVEGRGKVEAPVGYHTLKIGGNETALFVAPRRAPRPEKRWGLFAPLYAIHTRNTGAMGDLADMRAYRDWIAELGGSVVATLPLLAIDPEGDPSPYSPISRLFWNELYLDVRQLPEYQGEQLEQVEAESIDYKAVAKAKGALLEKLSRRFDGDVSDEVKDYARFRGDERYHSYVQHRMSEQMRAQQDLYLDFPLGVSPNGYDVHRYKEHFAQGVSVGAPPDLFFTKGQNWGFPPLDPDATRLRRHDYWRRCVRHHTRHASTLRIDHVMGLHRLFWIPNGAEAKDGVYVRYPEDELYAILLIEASRTNTAIVGEDLGTVPQYVPGAMKKRGLRRMYVVQYEQKLNHPPAESVASVNTHDMPTFAGFWNGDDIEDRLEQELLDQKGAQEEREKRAEIRGEIAAQLTARGLLQEGTENTLAVLQAVLEFVAGSDAEIVLVNLEDLWGEREPQNVPGVPGRSWRHRFRLSLEQTRNDETVTRILRAVAGRRRKVHGDNETE
ncbi:MAG TPA: 4-alpha-glucanotransferase [Thermoanaerobaculia bacterium]|jgi:4-alpha-glucanotransferase|nr:4-alpha-glucanotransferase [Thermoanaerobaculia bacterium]